MWTRKAVATLLLGFFVLGTLGVADAGSRRPLQDLYAPPTTGPGPDDEHPWEEVENNDGIQKILGTGNSFDLIFIGNIPVVVEMKVENAIPLFKIKRGK